MQVVVGVDEVGRGCWAGPLVVAAVVLHKRLRGLKDSKLLTRSQREVLSARIHKHASIGMGWITPADVDRLGLTEATRQAATEAVAQLDCAYDHIVMDGNYNYLSANPKAVAIIKADNSVPAVSAASIVAKVARDNYMRSIAEQFPQYQFEKHVGYGTRLHREMLSLHGTCELHRLSWRPFQQESSSV
jgi:ribonuclease HII